MDNGTSELRDNLFKEFFTCKDGIRLEDLMKSLKPVVEVWQKLHIILEENVDGFDKYSSIMKLKTVVIKGKHFLVVKKICLTYLIVDLDNNSVLNKEEALKYFKEKFFIENFGEVKSESKERFERIFNCLEYKGNINELIDFYVEYAEILNSSSSLTYRVKFLDAYATLSIYLSDGGNVLAFRTEDQILYDHLFFNNDLEPLRLQDAGEKVGIEKMWEMFSKIKDIRVPRSFIPESLQQFVTLDSGRK